MTTIAPTPRTPMVDRLRSERTVWLSSVRPDGRPHVVPVWFFWDGQAVDFFSKPTAQKVRNVRERPDVMLAIGEPDEEWDVDMVEGTATVLSEPTAQVIPPGLFEKYAEPMRRAGLDRETYVRVYSQPVRIRPTRFVGYGGKGWLDPASPTPDDVSDVVGHMMGARIDIAAHWRAIQRARREMATRRSVVSLDLLPLDD